MNNKTSFLFVFSEIYQVTKAPNIVYKPLKTVHILTVRAHSAEADLCCYVLRTPTPQVKCALTTC